MRSLLFSVTLISTLMAYHNGQDLAAALASQRPNSTWERTALYYQLGQYQRPSNFATGTALEIDWLEGLRLRVHDQGVYVLSELQPTELKRYLKAAHELY